MPRKIKTKEEILTESLKYKKEDEEILDAFRKEYGTQKKKSWVLRVKCLKHNHIFDIMYQNYKKGSGCKKCSYERQKYSIDKVQTIFKNNLKSNETFIKCFRKIRKNGNKEWWGRLNCNKHGEFDINLNSHKKGSGCPKCKGDRISKSFVLSEERVKQDFLNHLKENETLIKVYKKKRKNGYNEWWGALLCSEHGEFEMRRSCHLKGKGCPQCRAKRISKANMFSKNQVEQDFKKYLKPNENLIKVYQKKNCNNHNTWWATLLCSEHGEFEIEKQHHKNGEGCPFCRVKRISKAITLPKSQVIKDFKEQLKENETLVKVYQKKDTHRWYATINCEYHGIFEISKHNHKKGAGCPKCKASKGERKIREYLLNNNIAFEEQYKFEDCKYYRPLPFDFYIPSFNLAIEYQGRQHYEPIDIFGGEEAFKKQQKRDKIKREYCQKNNIKLLEIPYTEYDNIEKILCEELKI